MEYNRVADIKRLQIIINTLTKELPPKATILDVGCGNGIISRGVGKHGFNVLGIDLSPKAIEKARSLNNLPNVQFEVINAEELVSQHKTYQGVICSEVLEHLDHPEKLLNTLYQSLTDDGVLIVTVPNGKGPRELFVTKPMIRMQKRKGLLWKVVNKSKSAMGYTGTTVQSDADDLTHVQFFSKSHLYQLASETGFEIKKFYVTNFIDDVFPFSLLTRRLKFLQRMDAYVADRLPKRMAGSFVTVWKKKR